MAFQESNERIVPIENMLTSADDRAEYHEWLDSRTPHQRDSQSRDEVYVVAEGVHEDTVQQQQQDDDPEDDGQPSEYTEWQDYFGGDEHYDHSENACW